VRIDKTPRTPGSSFAKATADRSPTSPRIVREHHRCWGGRPLPPTSIVRANAVVRMASWASKEPVRDDVGVPGVLGVSSEAEACRPTA
jgi:hypothetical protein